MEAICTYFYFGFDDCGIRVLPMAASTVGGEINGNLAYGWDEDTASAVQTMTGQVSLGLGR